MIHDYTNVVLMAIMVFLIIGTLTCPYCFAINVTKILEEYVSICGPLLCNENIFGEIKNLPDPSANNKACPPCSCEMSCIQIGNCCPDFFFDMRLACVRTSVLQNGNFIPPRDRNNYLHNPDEIGRPILMITSCTLETELSNRNKCETSDVKETAMNNVPVTSNKTGFVYRNIHCLKCNNENEVDSIKWNFDFDCQSFDIYQTLNYISSYSEMIHTVDMSNCSVTYVAPENSKQIVTNACEDNGNFENQQTCNVSGTWAIYDPDIDFACQTYDQKINIFKNIFCYICNPPVYKGNVISTCNVTGLWNPYNRQLENACIQNKQSSVTGEFKNVYCYLCNRNNISPNTGYSYFYDAVVDIVYQSFRVTSFMYKFDIKEIDQYRIIRNILNSSKTVGNLSLPSSVSVLSSWTGMHYNSSLLTILKKYFAFTGNAYFCGNYSTFTQQDACSCNDHCLFQSKIRNFKCCIEILLKRKTICTDRKYSYSGRGYIVYEECNVDVNDTLHKLCYSNLGDNVFSFLPTTIFIDNSSIHYKNIFCMMCDQKEEIKKQQIEVENIKDMFWQFWLECDVNIPIFYHTSFIRFIKFFQDNRCKLTLEPRNNDPNISWACRQYETDNDFCMMCNPSTPEQNGTIKTCNETGMWGKYDSSIENNCLRFPSVEGHAPFKNIFCQTCNGMQVDVTIHGTIWTDNNYSTTCIGHCSIDINERLIRPSYRTLFSIMDNEVSETKQQTNCLSNQIFNFIENICMDVVCYPGRFLVNGDCVPLLTLTHDMGYILSLQLTGNSIQTNDIEAFLHSIENEVQFLIGDIIERHCDKWDFKSSLYLYKSPDVTRKGTPSSVIMFQKLHCFSQLKRSEIEESLLLFTKSTLNLTFSNASFHFEISQNSEAFILQSSEPVLESENITFISTNKYEFLNRYSHVTQLLTCKQVVLSQNKYDIDNDTLQLTLIPFDVKLSNLEYTVTPSAEVRICADVYLSILNSKNMKISLYEYVTGVILLCCTCISLICLLITFIIYTMFPSLRSLPGKNNMALIISMIFSHSLYQFGLYQTDTKIVCTIIGISIHYFWLVNFLCLNICSFHMFRVFRNLTSMVYFQESSKQTQTFIIYMVFSFGTPLVIIVVNIVLNLALADMSNVGYGGDICFLDKQISIILSFILPIISVCFTNIVFFIFTVKNIAKSAKQSEEEQVQSNRIYFSTYVKLFSITGASWIFQMIDSFLQSSMEQKIFSVLTSLLNVLQGVFIFVSYVCNKRVLSLLKQTFRSQTVSITESQGSESTIRTRL